MPPSPKAIDRQGLTDFAQRLIRTPSVSTQEGDLARLLVEEMNRVGFDRVYTDSVGNVIGQIGPDNGPTLLYNGHMDTVDVGDLSRWKRDPYGGEIENGILFGRGACDMKGALAAMVYAGRALVPFKNTLKGPLYVVGVVQEEPFEGLAMQHVVEQEGIQPDWVVLGEATNLQISRGHRGRIECTITVHGRSCHASAPSRGVNAIYEAARIIVGLELLTPQLGNDPLLGPGTIAVTEIHSQAGSRNVVPDYCQLCVDRRLTAGETERRALADIRRIVTREGSDTSIDLVEYESQSYTGHPLTGVKSFPFWVISEDDPLVRRTAEVIERTLGFVPRLGCWQFSTDGAYTMGEAGIPTVGFGPGDERYAHTTEDQVRIRDLVSATQVYTRLALRMLS